MRDACCLLSKKRPQNGDLQSRDVSLGKKVGRSGNWERPGLPFGACRDVLTRERLIDICRLLQVSPRWGIRPQAHWAPCPQGSRVGTQRASVRSSVDSRVLNACQVPGVPSRSGIPILPTLKVSGELSGSAVERKPGKMAGMLRRASKAPGELPRDQ